MDVASLIEQYGRDSQVTGISLVANPAYYTAGGLRTLTAMEKSGGVVTGYGKHVTSEVQTAILADTHSVSMTLADLEGRQFGWRAGT